MPENFVDRKSDLKAIENSVKNKFRWDWLEEKDCHGDYLSDYVRKLVQPGLAYCNYCNHRLDYSKKGKSFLKRHAESSGHRKKRNSVKGNQMLPAVFKATVSLEKGESVISKPLPYGAPQNVVDCRPSQSASSDPPQAPPSFKDRVSQQEALICSFIAEHTLPLSLVPDLIKLTQTLSHDHKALQSLSMERFTATYKLKQGLHDVTRKRIVSKLKAIPFSINLDEATSKSNRKRLLNILVCFFDPDLGRSVTHLYSSIELTTVNASTVHAAVTTKLKEDGIPFTNLISSLSDSAAYMRGAQNGFETKLREDAPHLLNIDGDVCHHVHNITKLFSSTLDPENTLTHLLDDIYKDFQYSPDIREDFTTICKILGVEEKQPKERVGHRWMSLYDSSKVFQELLDPLSVIYYAWLSSGDKDLYKSIITDIFVKHEVTGSGRQCIFSILRRLKTKNMTVLGSKRKQRVYKKLFDKRTETCLLSKAILSVFPYFKTFVLAFETKKSMLHKLHDSIIDLFRNFLKCFIKAQEIRAKENKLATLDLTDSAKFIPVEHINTGDCKSLLSSMRSKDALEFKGRLLHAYTSTALYMQKKLPLSNPLFTTLSLLDPLAFGQTESAIMLKKLPSFFPNISAPTFNQEVMDMQSDLDICTGSETDLDVWWNSVFQLNRYPSVQKIVTACLSIFTGPRVEQSFSLMNNIINQKRSSMSTNTYEAILCIKYNLLAQNKSSIDMYRREDSTNSPVDASLAWHFQTACNRHHKIMKARKEEVRRRTSLAVRGRLK